jgi:LPXTG-motif cell wall-anchored protein
VTGAQPDPPVALVAAGTVSLPRTGTSVVPMTLIGVTLIGVGLALFLRPRRRPYFIR